MRPIIALVILTLTLSLATFAGADPTPPVAASTAFNSYQRAFDWWQANARGETATLTQDDLSILSDGLAGTPTPEVRAALAKVRPYIDLMREGGSAKAYGLELDRSKGFELVLPHLGSLRNAARVLRLDAEVRMADGDVRGAADAIRAIVGFSDHTRQDSIIISSLVSGAIMSLGDSTIDRALSLGAFDKEAADELATAMESMRGNDSLHLSDAIRGEASMLRTSVERSMEDKEHSMQQLLGMPENASPEDFTPERLKEQLDSMEKLYGQAADAVAGPDRDAARAVLADIERRTASGEIGPLAKAMMPALLRAAEGCWKAEDLIAARYQMLDDIRSGRKDAAAFANAAYPYLQAAELVTTLEKERQATIEAARVAASALDAAAATNARRETARFREPLRTLFEAAAKRERCDFSISRAPRPALLMRYLPGLRGAIRIALADAALGPAAAGSAEGVRGGDVPAFTAEEAIALALRAARHLAMDPALGHSIVAASILKDAATGLDDAVAAKRLDAEALARLRTIANSMAGPDPIGLSKATETDRSLMQRRLAGWEGDPNQPEDLLKRRSDSLAGILFLQQILERESSQRSGPPEAFAAGLANWRGGDAMKSPLLGVGDLLDAAAVGEACDFVERWSTRNPPGAAAQDSWLAYVATFTWPVVVDVPARRDEAAKALARIDELLTAPAK